MDAIGDSKECLSRALELARGTAERCSHAHAVRRAPAISRTHHKCSRGGYHAHRHWSRFDWVGGSARLMLCWRGNELLSFQIFMVGGSRVLACHIGMQYPEARDLNLYFINWVKLIEFAIDHRIPCVDMGATTYTTKLLFGGYLDARLLYFRFRNPVWNSILSPLASFFDFERNDPELQRLLQSNDPPVRRGRGDRFPRSPTTRSSNRR